MGVAPSPGTEHYEHPDDARMAAFRRVYERHLVVEDIYPGMADRLARSGVERVAEVGGGRGPVADILGTRGVTTAVVDLDSQMLADAHRPAVRGDLRALPLLTGSMDAVVAANCLYFLPDPAIAIREAWRVLRPDGVFVASSPSRWNDPELEGIDPRWGEPTTFDAEDAPSLVSEVFGDVEVERWRMVAYRLPDHAAVADHLHAFNVPDWQDWARRIKAPLSITKVGAQVWARR